MRVSIMALIIKTLSIITRSILTFHVNKLDYGFNYGTQHNEFNAMLSLKKLSINDTSYQQHLA
jgi:hypothetical protein